VIYKAFSTIIIAALLMTLSVRVGGQELSSPSIPSGTASILRSRPILACAQIPQGCTENTDCCSGCCAKMGTLPSEPKVCSSKSYCSD
jgi:hypothetical protein